MLVEVKRLYNEIYQKFGAELLTKSFYGSEARWAHDLENIDYIIYLHGAELVFNASFNEYTEEERRQAVNRLISRRAAGLLMSTEDDRKPSKELIAYCDEKHFPLLWVNYNAPFIDMLHESFEILVYEDRNSRTREDAFRNAVISSDEVDRYVNLMETDRFFSQGKYTVLIASWTDARSSDKAADDLSQLFRCHISRNVTYMEGKTLIALLSGYSMQEIRSDILLMCKEEPNLRIAIGTTVDEPTEIRSSYDKAKLTLAMIPALRQQVMAYSDLGIYKMLYEIKDKELADEFIDEILGKLIRYDKKNRSDYMTVLESFMKNECMVSQTAEAIFFHRNTIKYKLAAIHEILGYDITLNENRFKIMMAFYLIKIRKN